MRRGVGGTAVDTDTLPGLEFDAGWLFTVVKVGGGRVGVGHVVDCVGLRTILWCQLRTV